MKAAVIEKQGGIENIVYREFADPVVGPRDVLVRCKAIGLNYFDIFVRRGMPGLPVPMPWISGADAAGEIAAIGSEVQGWKVGDRCLIDPLTNEGMMGEEVQGAFAEYCRIPQDFVIPLDPRLSFVEAATIPANYGTVYRMLFTNGGMQPDDLVLVLGASGGVGTATVQVVKAYGGRVIACAGSDEKCAKLKELGADHAINYKTLDFVDEVKRITAKAGVNVILDMVAGSYLERELRCLAADGRLVIIAVQGGTDAKADAGLILRNRLTVTGSTLRPRPVEFKSAIAAALKRTVWPWLERGTVKPVIHEVFPAAEAARAHALMETNAHIGKLVLQW